MKKKLLAILLFLLPVVARAAEIGVVALIEGEPTPSNPTAVPISTVEIDGLYYNLYDTNLAEVTHNPSVPTNEGCYSGDIIIPASVSYKDINYDVTRVGETAFMYCFGLTSVVLPNSVTSIGKNAFQFCTDLTSINIPDNVTVIEDYTFEDCRSLKSIIIPDGVTTIGTGAFDFCLDITSLTIPNSVTDIGENAFSFSGITSITIPDNVANIRRDAFSCCGDLKSVTIGKGVKEISKDVFTLCLNLTDVYCLTEDVPVTDSNAFSDCDLSVVTLHVPEGSIDKYRNTDPWSTFGSIVALTDEETSIKSVNGGDSSEILRFTLDGKRLNAPQKGLNIIKTRNGQTRKMLVK